MEHKYTNRLIKENSPYLLQHAHNPVDWFSWGEEAFEAARTQDKPIFLSIGYSTCHWCHVMEHESFSNERIAGIMNEHFISIKVDREQRPDVDSVYMNAVQMMTGSGGWPLSVFLTPDGKPFYGGTYFPPNDSYGRPGFERLLLAIAQSWKTDRHGLLSSADKISNVLAQTGNLETQQKVSVDVLQKANAQFSSTFDSRHGGFGLAPKFPQPSNLSMLLGYWYRTGDKKTLSMVEKTLDAMSNGGIRDHLGGGFHRYSTDAKWLVPHFEKMLYDQALLAKAYIQGYQVIGKEDFALVAGEIFDYVLTEMTEAKGGFYSAEDADSEGKEGWFYVWEAKEIKSILGAEDAEIFNVYYGVTKKGNFEEAKNILHITRPLNQVAKEFKKSASRIESVLAKGRAKLFAHRAKRIRPSRDDKIITGWNGLMISALAYGGKVLANERYVTAAEKCADFLLERLKQNGRLMRYYRNGQASGLGFLDDYAFLIAGLLDLYEATYDSRWLVEAKKLAEGMIELFGDDEGEGGFFLSGKDGEKLIVRNKPGYDGAVPSGNSIAVQVLVKLGRLTMEQRFTDRAQGVINEFANQMNRSPTSLSAMLIGVNFLFGPSQEIVIAGNRRWPQTKKMLRLVETKFLPNAVVLFNDEGGKELETVVEFVKYQKAVNGKATAYVCENYVCKKPVNTIGELKKLLEKTGQKKRDGEKVLNFEF